MRYSGSHKFTTQSQAIMINSLVYEAADDRSRQSSNSDGISAGWQRSSSTGTGTVLGTAHYVSHAGQTDGNSDGRHSSGLTCFGRRVNGYLTIVEGGSSAQMICCTRRRNLPTNGRLSDPYAAAGTVLPPAAGRVGYSRSQVFLRPAKH